MDIILEDISKKFEDKLVISNLNITIPEGRISCLMGPSGIGKTTLINIIMGLIKPDSGKLRGMKERQLAAVFQEDRLIEHWNAVKNVKLACGRDITLRAIITELERLGLSKELDKPVSEFSGGMRRRVAIVRALLARSNLVILDEPFRGMDQVLKKQMIDYIKHNTEGKTVIVVTHEKEDVRLLEANLILLQ